MTSCVWNLRVFPEDAWGCQSPFVLCLHPQGFLQRGVRASRGSGWPGSLSATNASPGPPGLGTYPTSVCRKDGWIGRKLQTGPPVNATQPSWQQDDLSEGPLRTYLTGLTDPQTLCPRLLPGPQEPSPRALGPNIPIPGSLPALPAPLFSVCTECFSCSDSAGSSGWRAGLFPAAAQPWNPWGSRECGQVGRPQHLRSTVTPCPPPTRGAPWSPGCSAPLTCGSLQVWG